MGRRIYVTTAIAGEVVASAAVEEEPQGEGRRRRRGVQPDQTLKFALLAIDRKDGRIAWQRIVREEKPHEGHHPDATWVSNYSVTDGQHIYAYFGSRGLYCFDMEGNSSGRRIWAICKRAAVLARAVHRRCKAIR